MKSMNKMKEMVGGCCVCSDERGWAENPLVYCDGSGCNVAVHQACYGIITVPSGPWYCRKCESQERAARVRCEMCPQKDGALKRTDTGGWCHVVCALFIPEAWFGNVQTMEPIILKGVPPERFNKVSCYICEESNRQAKATTGGCMQCNKSGCKAYFHVTCAQQLGLLCEEAGNYDNVKYCGYCSYHFKKLKKDRFIKAIPAFKPIQGELIAHKGESPEKIYQFSDEAEVFDIKAQREKKKDSSVKQIPPFKPLPSADATPDNTPEKAHPLKLKEKRGPPGQESSASPSTGTSSDITSSGKFTTANFREATITHSPANLFMFEHDKKVKNLQARKDIAHPPEKKEAPPATKKAADKEPAPSTASAKKAEKESPVAMTKKEATAAKKSAEKVAEKVDKAEKEKGEKVKPEKDGEKAAKKGGEKAEKVAASESSAKKEDGVKQEAVPGDVKAGGPGATEKNEQRKSSSFAELASAPLFAMGTTASGGSKGQEKHAAPEPNAPAPPAVTSSNAIQSQPTGSFSLSYETFLSKNAAVSKDDVSSPETASRKRPKAQDSGEKKAKAKKQKVAPEKGVAAGPAAQTKTKMVKDMLTSPTHSSPPGSPTPGSTPPYNKDGGSGEKVKAKQNRKRKDSASQNTGPVYSSAAYARDKTLPISLSSLQKGEKGVDSPQLSPTSKLFQTDLSPAKGLTEGIHESLMNGSMRGLVSPPKPLTIKTSLASPKSGSEVPVGWQHFPRPEPFHPQPVSYPTIPPSLTKDPDEPGLTIKDITLKSRSKATHLNHIVDRLSSMLVPKKRRKSRKKKQWKIQSKASHHEQSGDGMVQQPIHREAMATNTNVSQRGEEVPRFATTGYTHRIATEQQEELSGSEEETLSGSENCCQAGLQDSAYRTTSSDVPGVAETTARKPVVDSDREPLITNENQMLEPPMHSCTAAHSASVADQCDSVISEMPSVRTSSRRAQKLAQCSCCQEVEKPSNKTKEIKVKKSLNRRANRPTIEYTVRKQINEHGFGKRMRYNKEVHEQEHVARQVGTYSRQSNTRSDHEVDTLWKQKPTVNIQWRPPYGFHPQDDKWLPARTSRSAPFLFGVNKRCSSRNYFDANNPSCTSFNDALSAPQNEQLEIINRQPTPELNRSFMQDSDLGRGLHRPVVSVQTHGLHNSERSVPRQTLLSHVMSVRDHGSHESGLSVTDQVLQRPMIVPDNGQHRLMNVPDKDLQRPVSVPDQVIQRPLSVHDQRLQRPMSVPDQRLQRPMSVPDKGLQRPMSVPDKDLQRPISAPDQGLQRPMSVPDQGLQRPLSVPDQGLQRQMSVPDQVIQRSMSVPEQGLQRPMSVPDQGLQRPMNDPDQGMQRPMSDPDQGLQRPMSVPDQGLQRPISVPDQGLQRPMSVPEQGLQRPMSVPAQVIQRSMSVPEQGLQRTMSVPDQGLQRPMHDPDQGLQRPMSGPDQGLQRHMSVPDKGLQSRMRAPDQVIQRPMIVPDQGLQRPMSVQDKGMQRSTSGPDKVIQRPMIVPDQGLQRPMSVPDKGMHRPMSCPNKGLQRQMNVPDQVIQRPMIVPDQDLQRPMSVEDKGLKRPMSDLDQVIQHPMNVSDKGLQRHIMSVPDQGQKRSLMGVLDQGPQRPTMSVPDQGSQRYIMSVPDKGRVINGSEPLWPNATTGRYTHGHSARLPFGGQASSAIPVDERYQTPSSKPIGTRPTTQLAPFSTSRETVLDLSSKASSYLGQSLIALGSNPSQSPVVSNCSSRNPGEHPMYPQVRQICQPGVPRIRLIGVQLKDSLEPSPSAVFTSAQKRNTDADILPRATTLTVKMQNTLTQSSSKKDFFMQVPNAAAQQVPQAMTTGVFVPMNNPISRLAPEATIISAGNLFGLPHVLTVSTLSSTLPLSLSSTATVDGLSSICSLLPSVDSVQTSAFGLETATNESFDVKQLHSSANSGVSLSIPRYTQPCLQTPGNWSLNSAICPRADLVKSFTNEETLKDMNHKKKKIPAGTRERLIAAAMSYPFEDQRPSYSNQDQQSSFPMANQRSSLPLGNPRSFFPLRDIRWNRGEPSLGYQHKGSQLASTKQNQHLPYHLPQNLGRTPLAGCLFTTSGLTASTTCQRSYGQLPRNAQTAQHRTNTSISTAVKFHGRNLSQYNQYLGPNTSGAVAESTAAGLRGSPGNLNAEDCPLDESYCSVNLDQYTMAHTSRTVADSTGNGSGQCPENFNIVESPLDKTSLNIYLSPTGPQSVGLQPIRNKTRITLDTYRQRQKSTESRMGEPSRRLDISMNADRDMASTQPEKDDIVAESEKDLTSVQNVMKMAETLENVTSTQSVIKMAATSNNVTSTENVTEMAETLGDVTPKLCDNMTECMEKIDSTMYDDNPLAETKTNVTSTRKEKVEAHVINVSYPQNSNGQKPGLEKSGTPTNQGFEEKPIKSMSNAPFSRCSDGTLDTFIDIDTNNNQEDKRQKLGMINSAGGNLENKSTLSVTQWNTGYVKSNSDEELYESSEPPPSKPFDSGALSLKGESTNDGWNTTNNEVKPVLSANTALGSQPVEIWKRFNDNLANKGGNNENNSAPEGASLNSNPNTAQPGLSQRGLLASDPMNTGTVADDDELCISVEASVVAEGTNTCVVSPLGGKSTNRDFEHTLFDSISEITGEALNESSNESINRTTIEMSLVEQVRSNKGSTTKSNDFVEYAQKEKCAFTHAQEFEHAYALPASSIEKKFGDRYGNNYAMVVIQSIQHKIPTSEEEDVDIMTCVTENANQVIDNWQRRTEEFETGGSNVEILETKNPEGVILKIDGLRTEILDTKRLETKKPHDIEISENSRSISTSETVDNLSCLNSEITAKSSNDHKLVEMIDAPNNHTQTDEMIDALNDHTQTDAMIDALNDHTQTGEMIDAPNDHTQTEEMIDAPNDHTQTEEMIDALNDHTQTEEMIDALNDHTQTDKMIDALTDHTQTGEMIDALNQIDALNDHTQTDDHLQTGDHIQTDDHIEHDGLDRIDPSTDQAKPDIIKGVIQGANPDTMLGPLEMPVAQDASDGSIQRANDGTYPYHNEITLPDSTVMSLKSGNPDTHHYLLVETPAPDRMEGRPVGSSLDALQEQKPLNSPTSGNMVESVGQAETDITKRPNEDNTPVSDTKLSEEVRDSSEKGSADSELIVTAVKKGRLRGRNAKRRQMAYRDPKKEMITKCSAGNTTNSNHPFKDEKEIKGSEVSPSVINATQRVSSVRAVKNEKCVSTVDPIVAIETINVSIFDEFESGTRKEPPVIKNAFDDLPTYVAPRIIGTITPCYTKLPSEDVPEMVDAEGNEEIESTSGPIYASGSKIREQKGVDLNSILSPAFQPQVVIDTKEFEQARELFKLEAKEHHFCQIESGHRRRVKKEKEKMKENERCASENTPKHNKEQHKMARKRRNDTELRCSSKKTKGENYRGKVKKEKPGSDDKLWHALKRPVTRSYVRLSNEYIENVVVKAEREQDSVFMYVDPCVKETTDIGRKKRKTHGRGKSTKRKVKQEKTFGHNRDENSVSIDNGNQFENESYNKGTTENDDWNASINGVNTSESIVSATENYVNVTEGEVRDTEQDAVATQNEAITYKNCVNITETYMNTVENGVNSVGNNVNTSKDDVKTAQNDAYSIKDDVKTTENDVKPAENHVNFTENYINTTENDVNTAEYYENITENDVNATRDDVNIIKNDVNSTDKTMAAIKDDMNTTQNEITTKEYVNAIENEMRLKLNGLNVSDHDAKSAENDMDIIASHVSATKTDVNTTATDVNVIRKEMLAGESESETETFPIENKVNPTENDVNTLRVNATVKDMIPEENDLIVRKNEASVTDKNVSTNDNSGNASEDSDVKVTKIEQNGENVSEDNDASCTKKHDRENRGIDGQVVDNQTNVTNTDAVDIVNDVKIIGNDRKNSACLSEILADVREVAFSDVSTYCPTSLSQECAVQPGTGALKPQPCESTRYTRCSVQSVDNKDNRIVPRMIDMNSDMVGNENVASHTGEQFIVMTTLDTHQNEIFRPYTPPVKESKIDKSKDLKLTSSHTEYLQLAGCKKNDQDSSSYKAKYMGTVSYKKKYLESTYNKTNYVQLSPDKAKSLDFTFTTSANLDSQFNKTEHLASTSDKAKYQEPYYDKGKDPDSSSDQAKNPDSIYSEVGKAEILEFSSAKSYEVAEDLLSTSDPTIPEESISSKSRDLVAPNDKVMELDSLSDEVELGLISDKGKDSDYAWMSSPESGCVWDLVNWSSAEEEQDLEDRSENEYSHSLENIDVPIVVANSMENETRNANHCVKKDYLRDKHQNYADDSITDKKHQLNLGVKLSETENGPIMTDLKPNGAENSEINPLPQADEEERWSVRTGDDGEVQLYVHIPLPLIQDFLVDYNQTNSFNIGNALQIDSKQDQSSSCEATDTGYPDVPYTTNVDDVKGPPMLNTQKVVAANDNTVVAPTSAKAIDNIPSTSNASELLVSESKTEVSTKKKAKKKYKPKRLFSWKKGKSNKRKTKEMSVDSCKCEDGVAQQPSSSNKTIRADPMVVLEQLIPMVGKQDESSRISTGSNYKQHSERISGQQMQSYDAAGDSELSLEGEKEPVEHTQEALLESTCDDADVCQTKQEVVEGTQLETTTSSHGRKRNYAQRFVKDVLMRQSSMKKNVKKVKGEQAQSETNGFMEEQYNSENSVKGLSNQKSICGISEKSNIAQIKKESYPKPTLLKNSKMKASKKSQPAKRTSAKASTKSHQAKRPQVQDSIGQRPAAITASMAPPQSQPAHKRHLKASTKSTSTAKLQNKASNKPRPPKTNTTKAYRKPKTFKDDKTKKMPAAKKTSRLQKTKTGANSFKRVTKYEDANVETAKRKLSFEEALSQPDSDLPVKNNLKMSKGKQIDSKALRKKPEIASDATDNRAQPERKLNLTTSFYYTDRSSVQGKGKGKARKKIDFQKKGRIEEASCQRPTQKLSSLARLEQEINAYVEARGGFETTRDLSSSDVSDSEHGGHSKSRFEKYRRLKKTSPTASAVLAEKVVGYVKRAEMGPPTDVTSPDQPDNAHRKTSKLLPCLVKRNVRSSANISKPKTQGSAPVHEGSSAKQIKYVTYREYFSASSDSSDSAGNMLQHPKPGPSSFENENKYSIAKAGENETNNDATASDQENSLERNEIECRQIRDVFKGLIRVSTEQHSSEFETVIKHWSEKQTRGLGVDKKAAGTPESKAAITEIETAGNVTRYCTSKGTFTKAADYLTLPGKFTQTTDNPAAKGKFTKTTDDPAAEGKFTKTTDNPTSEGKFTTTTDDPAAEGKFTKTTDNPTSEGKFTTTTDDPAAEGKFTKTRDNPTSEGKFTTTTDDPAAEGKFTKTTDNPAAEGKFTNATDNPTVEGKFAKTTDDPAAEGSDTETSSVKAKEIQPTNVSDGLSNGKINSDSGDFDHNAKVNSNSDDLDTNAKVNTNSDDLGTVENVTRKSSEDDTVRIRISSAKLIFSGPITVQMPEIASNGDRSGPTDGPTSIEKVHNTDVDILVNEEEKPSTNTAKQQRLEGEIKKSAIRQTLVTETPHPDPEFEDSETKDFFESEYTNVFKEANARTYSKRDFIEDTMRKRDAVITSGSAKESPRVSASHISSSGSTVFDAEEDSRNLKHTETLQCGATFQETKGSTISIFSTKSNGCGDCIDEIPVTCKVIDEVVHNRESPDSAVESPKENVINTAIQSPSENHMQTAEESSNENLINTKNTTTKKQGTAHDTTTSDQYHDGKFCKSDAIGANIEMRNNELYDRKGEPEVSASPVEYENHHEEVEKDVPNIHEVGKDVPNVHEVEKDVPNVHEIEKDVSNGHDEVEKDVPNEHDEVEKDVPNVHEVEKDVPNLHEIEKDVSNGHDEVEKDVPNEHDKVEKDVLKVHDVENDVPIVNDDVEKDTMRETAKKHGHSGHEVDENTTAESEVNQRDFEKLRSECRKVTVDIYKLDMSLASGSGTFDISFTNYEDDTSPFHESIDVRSENKVDSSTVDNITESSIRNRISEDAAGPISNTIKESFLYGSRIQQSGLSVGAEKDCIDSFNENGKSRMNVGKDLNSSVTLHDPSLKTSNEQDSSLELNKIKDCILVLHDFQNYGLSSKEVQDSSLSLNNKQVSPNRTTDCVSPKHQAFSEAGDNRIEETHRREESFALDNSGTNSNACPDANRESILSAPENISSAQKNVSSAHENVSSVRENVSSVRENVSSAHENVPKAPVNISSALENVPPAHETVPIAQENVHSANENAHSAHEKVPTTRETVHSANANVHSAQVPTTHETVHSAYENVHSAQVPTTRENVHPVNENVHSAQVPTTRENVHPVNENVHSAQVPTTHENVHPVNENVRSAQVPTTHENVHPVNENVHSAQVPTTHENVHPVNENVRSAQVPTTHKNVHPVNENVHSAQVPTMHENVHSANENVHSAQVPTTHENVHPVNENVHSAQVPTTHENVHPVNENVRSAQVPTTHENVHPVNENVHSAQVPTTHENVHSANANVRSAQVPTTHENVHPVNENVHSAQVPTTRENVHSANANVHSAQVPTTHENVHSANANVHSAQVPTTRENVHPVNENVHSAQVPTTRETVHPVNENVHSAQVPTTRENVHSVNENVHSAQVPTTRETVHPVNENVHSAQVPTTRENVHSVNENVHSAQVPTTRETVHPVNENVHSAQVPTTRETVHPVNENVHSAQVPTTRENVHSVNENVHSDDDVVNTSTLNECVTSIHELHTKPAPVPRMEVVHEPVPSTLEPYQEEYHSVPANEEPSEVPVSDGHGSRSDNASVTVDLHLERVGDEAEASVEIEERSESTSEAASDAADKQDTDRLNMEVVFKNDISKISPQPPRNPASSMTVVANHTATNACQPMGNLLATTSTLLMDLCDEAPLKPWFVEGEEGQCEEPGCQLITEIKMRIGSLPDLNCSRESISGTELSPKAGQSSEQVDRGTEQEDNATEQVDHATGQADRATEQSGHRTAEQVDHGTKQVNHGREQVDHGTEKSHHTTNMMEMSTKVGHSSAQIYHCTDITPQIFESSLLDTTLDKRTSRTQSISKENIQGAKVDHGTEEIDQSADIIPQLDQIRAEKSLHEQAVSRESLNETAFDSANFDHTGPLNIEVLFKNATCRELPESPLSPVSNVTVSTNGAESTRQPIGKLLATTSMALSLLSEEITGEPFNTWCPQDETHPHEQLEPQFTQFQMRVGSLADLNSSRETIPGTGNEWPSNADYSENVDQAPVTMSQLRYVSFADDETGDKSTYALDTSRGSRTEDTGLNREMEGIHLGSAYGGLNAGDCGSNLFLLQQRSTKENKDKSANVVAPGEYSGGHSKDSDGSSRLRITYATRNASNVNLDGTDIRANLCPSKTAQIEDEEQICSVCHTPPHFIRNPGCPHHGLPSSRIGRASGSIDPSCGPAFTESDSSIEADLMSQWELLLTDFNVENEEVILRTPARSSSMPTSMEQLLERQWDQGSAFLMEQGQHFDIASLLNCLHQLRQENQRLEDHIQNLSARRDHLLAVNARLALPHAPIHNAPSNNTGGGGPGGGAAAGAGASPEGGSRPGRLNNFLPPLSGANENAGIGNAILQEAGGNRVARSPGAATGATQNHGNPHNSSSPVSKSAPGGGSSGGSGGNSGHGSAEGRSGPAVTTSNDVTRAGDSRHSDVTTTAASRHNDVTRSTAGGGLTHSGAALASNALSRTMEEQQRLFMAHQQNMLLTQEQQQQMMFQILQQQAAYGALGASAAHPPGNAPHPAPRPHAAPTNHSSPTTAKAGGDKTKEK